MSGDIGLGRLITESRERDAVHVAVVPVMAAQVLSPGERVGLDGDGKAMAKDEPIGIVDPFLWEDVQPGERFWLWLTPGSITSLRHDWTHPAFEREGPAQEKPKRKVVNTRSPSDWRTPTVLRLCEVIRNGGDFDAGPALADALEEAGCPNDAVMLSLRSQHDYARAGDVLFRAVALVYSDESAAAVERIDRIADAIDITYTQLMRGARDWIGSDGEDYTTEFGSENWRDEFPGYAEEFWECYALVTGTENVNRGSFFSCSC